jgi:diguanylate cyclase (GGDEF)-like protein
MMYHQSSDVPCEDANRSTDWFMMNASLASLSVAFASKSAKSRTLLVDLLSQAEYMRDGARSGNHFHLAGLLNRLLQEIRREIINPSEDFSRILRIIRHVELVIKNRILITDQGEHPIALLITESEPTDELLDALIRHGYAIHTFSLKKLELSQLQDLVAQSSMVICILSADCSIDLLLNSLLPLAEVIKDRPSLLISNRDSFAERLMAVKIGLTHFLTEPLNLNILNTIFQASRISENFDKPIQVLMIDDMVTAGIYWGKRLTDKSIVFKFESNPENAYLAAIDSPPDIILLDLYMPGISGIELAKIFREHPLLFDVPILFMSTEDDDNCRMDAKIQGGDDFLNKSIPTDYLIKMIKYRAFRYRQSSAIKRSDSLTGLMNHNAIKDFINTEIERASRHNNSLAIVLLDIDHFKKVNDINGHQAGDIVIRRLSNMLNTRLRRYDGVGRYGGEEFMLVLPNTDEIMALNLVNRIRVDFSRRPINIGNDIQITVTFSAGLASFPLHQDITSLIEAADKNLYLAKKAGRNRVICTPPPSST